MLTQFRNKHVKKVLWVLTVIIILSFGLWRASSLKGAKPGPKVFLNNKKIPTSKLDYYFKMAQVYLLINSQEERKVKYSDIQNLGLDFLILLKQTKREKINVGDEEVIRYMRDHRFMQEFFPEDKFNETIYGNFLKFVSLKYALSLSPRTFEEYIRNFAKIDKLFERNIKVQVSEDETKELYKKDNQKAKIAYLSIPYEKFKVEIGITPKEIETFYNENKSLFKVEPQVNIDYVLIDKEAPFTEEDLDKLVKIKTLEEISEKFSLKINESGFIGLNDPIAEVGWESDVNQMAFSLEKGQVSLPLDVEKGILIFEKKDHREAYIPALEEMNDQVKEKLVAESAKNEAQRFTKDLLLEIKDKSINDLKKLALIKKLEFKETDYFKYYDYIEGLGLDKAVSEAVFSLEIDQIYLEPIFLASGAFIIQLKELTKIDQDDYETRKQIYTDLIKQNKGIAEKIKFLAKLKEDVEFRVVLPKQ